MADWERITLDDVLEAIDGDGRFFVVAGRIIRKHPGLGERDVDRALQSFRKAGVIESVARRWRKAEGRSDG